MGRKKGGRLRIQEHEEQLSERMRLDRCWGQAGMEDAGKGWQTM